jgi:hypothetical protein
MLNEILSAAIVAEYSFTGMATSPKEIVKEAMDRASLAMVAASPSNTRAVNVGTAPPVSQAVEFNGNPFPCRTLPQAE